MLLINTMKELSQSNETSRFCKQSKLNFVFHDRAIWDLGRGRLLRHPGSCNEKLKTLC